MPTPNYDTDMGDQSIDVSASTRKFQNSIVIKQDEEKSGILGFLQKAESENPDQAPPRRIAPSTVRPRRGVDAGGSY